MSIFITTSPAFSSDRFEFSRTGMGTTLRAVLYAPDQPAANAAAAKAFAEFDAVDDALSDYRPDTEISRLGSLAGKRGIEISNVTTDALRAALAFADETHGAFDPTVAPLVILWRKARQTGKLPSERARRKAFALVGYHGLKLGPASARLERAGMKLDMGGIGKGFACDRALAALRDAGFPIALVSAGGDFAAGDPPPSDASGWRIRVEGGPLLTVSRCGVSTSGDTEQHVVINGHRYSHIIDPRTGQPVEQMGFVTVVAENATASDALATGITVLGPEAGLALATGRPGTQARIRWRAETVTRTVTTPGFDALIAREPFHFVAGETSRELRLGDTPVWRTITSEPEYSAAGFKVYTHLFDPATGALLTGARLPLYPHHRGLYVGWQKVHDGAGAYNFWEVPDTAQRFAGFAAERERADAEEAVEAARIEWTSSTGGVIVRELRELRARRAGPGRVRIDVTSILTAGGASLVVLDGNAHHAGCQIRLAGSATELVWDRPPQARTTGDDIWTGADWTGARFLLNGSPEQVLHADDPENPRPVEYSTRPYGRFGSRFTARLEPGVPGTFRWHVLIGSAAPAIAGPSVPSSPPAGATILFDGASTAMWQHADGAACRWTVADGALTVTHGDLVTKEPLGDMRLHLEFRIPPSPAGATAQDRSNSGVYIQQRYEIQILDSFGDPPVKNGCGAIYEQRPPRSNACLPAGQWQTYDIEFTQPRWGPDGAKLENARATVRLNGVLIHQNAEITAKTGHGEQEGPAPRPLKLQDHSHAVSFRNIWIAPLP